MRRVALVAASVLAAACATSREYPHPLTGEEMWGYVLTAESRPTLQMVTYAADRPSCEFSRAMAQTHSGIPVPSQVSVHCELLAVLPYQQGAEPVYWVFSTQNDVEQFAVGGNDRAFCASFRQEALKALRGDNTLSECEPVIVKRAM